MHYFDYFNYFYYSILSSDTFLAKSCTLLIISDIALAVFNTKLKCTNHPNCTILDSWVFEKFILADEPFTKTLRNLKT